MSLSAPKDGCTAEQLKYLRAIGRQMEASGFARQRTHTGAFAHQRVLARRRGISWELGLWDWWSIWQESGHWLDRGKGGGKYVMSRVGDSGPYAVGNVFIDASRRNSGLTPLKVSGLPLGVWRSRRKFVAVKTVDGRRCRIGLFSTPEDAAKAYAEFVG